MKNIDKVKAARDENPNISAADIAKNLGVSRELVRQLLCKLGLPTKVFRTTRQSTRQSACEVSQRYDVYVPPATIGAIGELEVCASLLKMGYGAFRSVSPNAVCDIVAISPLGDLIKIEVRSAKKGKCCTKGEYDVLAAVDRDGKITYTPTLDGLTKNA